MNRVIISSINNNSITNLSEIYIGGFTTLELANSYQQGLNTPLNLEVSIASTGNIELFSTLAANNNFDFNHQDLNLDLDIIFWNKPAYEQAHFTIMTVASGKNVYNQGNISYKVGNTYKVISVGWVGQNLVAIVEKCSTLVDHASGRDYCNNPNPGSGGGGGKVLDKNTDSALNSLDSALASEIKSVDFNRYILGAALRGNSDQLTKLGFNLEPINNEALLNMSITNIDNFVSGLNNSNSQPVEDYGSGVFTWINSVYNSNNVKDTRP